MTTIDRRCRSRCVFGASLEIHVIPTYEPYLYVLSWVCIIHVTSRSLKSSQGIFVAVAETLLVAYHRLLHGCQAESTQVLLSLLQP